MSTAVAQVSARDLFFAQLHTAASRALLLDYDGTVAPFTADRRRALPYADIPELLDCIASTCHTRVILISGRAARELPPLLGITPPPEIWGCHGLERLLPDGRYELAYIGETAERTLMEAAIWLEAQGLEPVCELKPGAIAVHWRGLGQRQIQEVRTNAYRALSVFAGRGELSVAEFNGGVEIRVKAPNKGDAVRAILKECRPDTPVACLGDDVSDEDAFRALNGRGLTVLVRPTYRFTAAQLWLQPPGDVIQFLTDWVRACGGDL
jgi:trehalose 6-phosphate phosphatase